MNIEEAVEYLKNCLNDEYNFKNATRKKDKDAIETLLTAYEKQQKEIEDLTTVYLNGFYDGEKKVKDKIKVKIELMNINIINAEKFDCDYIGQCRFVKKVLQSLLEKE